MIEALLAALAGLLIGSFLNVCIYRLPRDLSVVAPRSFCPNCDRGIAWYDNVPLLSYMLLRGRCRNCRERISWRYPLVELLTAALFFTAVLVFGLNAISVKYCIFAAIAIALVFADFEERILPDEFTLGGIVVGVVVAWFVRLPFDVEIWRMVVGSIHDPRVLSVIASAFAAAFTSLTLWFVGFLYQKLRHREGLGLGDVKMVAMIGAFLGLQGALLTLVLGSILGALVGVFFIWFTKKDAATYELPFGSFLGIASLAVAFRGGQILLDWYRQMGM